MLPDSSVQKRYLGKILRAGHESMKEHNLDTVTGLVLSQEVVCCVYLTVSLP